MKYRQLGAAGVKVSVLGVGSYLTIGMSVDEAAAREIVRRAYDLGVNFFDTANAYNRGEAEKVLGRQLADFPRESLVIATKAWAPMGDGPNDAGLSAKHLFEQCHASLRRLGVDYVDLYQCHRPDARTPLEETVRAMEDLARSGKILYWGTSEWPAWLIARANAIADRNHFRPAVSNQPRYNLLYRQPEAELFPFCRHEGIGNVVFSPLAHGVLTGKYGPGEAPPEGTRAADPDQNAVMMGMYWTDEKLVRARQFKGIAEEMGLAASQLALAWTLRRPEVASAIMGASRASQVDENAAAVEVEIPDDVLERLDALFPGPAETYPL
ncbi:MAG: aldo/keto reductase family protein [Planctomycetia bacterium]|nr:aldo/keto reductase family protein [Planctomycetia bacterium]